MNRRTRAHIRADGSCMAVDPDRVLVLPSEATALLFAAIIAKAKSEHVRLAVAESMLLETAMSGGANFEDDLAAAAVERFARSLPNASREEIERAVRVDVARHVGGPMRLARAEPWGSA
jgi:hypothetical protein